MLAFRQPQVLRAKAPRQGSVPPARRRRHPSKSPQPSPDELDRAHRHYLIEPSDPRRERRPKPLERWQWRRRRRHVKPRHRPPKKILDPRCVVRQQRERRPLARQAHPVDVTHTVRVRRPEVEPPHIPHHRRKTALTRRRRDLPPVTNSLPDPWAHERRSALERTEIDGRAVKRASHAPRRPHRERGPPPLEQHVLPLRARARRALHARMDMIDHGDEEPAHCPDTSNAILVPWVCGHSFLVQLPLR